MRLNQSVLILVLIGKSHVESLNFVQLLFSMCLSLSLFILALHQCCLLKHYSENKQNFIYIFTILLGKVAILINLPYFPTKSIMHYFLVRSLLLLLSIYVSISTFLIFLQLNSQNQKYSIMVLLFVLIVLLFSQTSCFFLQLTQKCTDTLPYGTNNINLAEYHAWYGKLGEQLNGTTYQTGHAFERHIAVAGKCSTEQKKDNKTVFKDIGDFYKTLSLDVTDCVLTSEKAFNFLQHHQIASASNYIHAIDCKTDTEYIATKYFIEFKRAIRKENPSQSEYMASMKTSVWTLYPER